MKKKFWNGVENRRADNGVSEIIGNILLLGIKYLFISKNNDNVAIKTVKRNSNALMKSGILKKNQQIQKYML